MAKLVESAEEFKKEVLDFPGTALVYSFSAAGDAAYPARRARMDSALDAAQADWGGRLKCLKVDLDKTPGFAEEHFSLEPATDPEYAPQFMIYHKGVLKISGGGWLPKDTVADLLASAARPADAPPKPYFS